MSDYIITCYDELAIWLENNVDSMKEIVRCRDCEHYDSERYGCWWFAHAERQSDCSWADEPSDVEPDGFCAWGIKKGDDR